MMSARIAPTQDADTAEGGHGDRAVDVLSLDAGDGVLTHAVEGEDDLHEGGSGEQGGDAEREIGSGRDQRGAQRVLHHGPGPPQTLRASGADEVGAQRVQHQVSLDAAEERRVQHDQHHGGQHQVLGPVEQPRTRIASCRARLADELEDPQTGCVVDVGRPHLQHAGQHERGDGEEEQGGEGEEPIGHLVLAGRGPGADEDTTDDADQGTDGDQAQTDPDAPAHLLVDARAGR